MTKRVNLAIVTALAAAVMSAAPLVAEDYDKLRTSLAYLKKTVPEVAWVR